MTSDHTPAVPPNKRPGTHAGIRRGRTGAKKRPHLNDTHVDRIVEAVRSGAYVKDAAAYAGLHESTVYRYLATAQGPPPDPDEYGGPRTVRYRDAIDHYERCVRLHERISEAEASAKLASIGRIRRAGQQGDWKADAWYLERKYPAEYARRFEVTGRDGQPLRVEVEQQAERLGVALDAAMTDVGMSDDQRLELRSALARRLRELVHADAAQQT